MASCCFKVSKFILCRHRTPPSVEAPRPHKKQKHHHHQQQAGDIPATPHTPHLTSTQISTPGVTVTTTAREATPSVSTIRADNSSTSAAARVALQPLSATVCHHNMCV